MRKRTEVVAEIEQAGADAARDIVEANGKQVVTLPQGNDKYPMTGDMCGPCWDVGMEEPQFKTPHGVVCKFGHGGADPAENAAGEKRRAPQVDAGRSVKTNGNTLPVEGTGRTAKAPHAEVVDTSAKLAKELAKDGKADPLDWGKANRGAEVPVGGKMQRIIDAVFDIPDPMALYEKLEKALRVGENRSEMGALAKALDEAEANARLAHRLWVTTKVEHQVWELDNDVVFGAMRGEATAHLQREKDKGLRNKTITDADVAAACSTLYPDEWRAQERRRRKFEGTVKSMENLTECWMSRCRSLQTMVGKSR